MTDEEKVAMYMKCTKIKLINMLIQANKMLDEYYRIAPRYGGNIKDLKATYMSDAQVKEVDKGGNIKDLKATYMGLTRKEFITLVVILGI